MPSLSGPRPKSFLFALLILSTSLTYLATSTVQTIQFSHNHFHYGAKLTPHPDKVEKGGEDAFFANNRVLAVADGVGGWTLQGIDPSKYSKALCHNVGVLLNEQSDLYSNNPKLIIAEAARRDPHEGSSTFVVVTIDKEQPVLRTSYIGDSLYVIYRKIGGKWGIVFEAEEQQKAFNFPFQLGNNGGDPPQTAREFRHDVEDKDIVVVASDGLFDNLTADQVLKQLLPYIDEEGEVKAPQAAAERLAKAAYDLSLDKNYDSPFAQRAFQARLLFNGGKSDDITVIVGQVKLVKSEEELERERLVEEVIRESQKKSESLESTEGGESPERQKVQDNDL